MKEIRILGIYLNDRVKEVGLIQTVLTKYGCTIRTRLGLHSTDATYAEDTGLILLELSGDPDECMRLENELHSIENLEVQKMVFIK